LNERVSHGRGDEEAVRHLLALGYVDPEEISAREAALRSERKAELARAIALYEQGQEQDAVALFEHLTRVDPEWITVHQRLAEIHYRAGRWADAQGQLDWLNYHGVESPRLSLMAGSMALRRRDMQAALELLEYAQFAEPEPPGVDGLLGTVLLRLQRLERAETAFRRAIERNPHDIYALDGLAVIALQRGQFDEAAGLALQALEHDMRFFRAHLHLGIALTRLGRSQEAMQALETAARLEPYRTAPIFWLRRIGAARS
jgi:tetratricopeptide (TPR) repeat protein